MMAVLWYHHGIACKAQECPASERENKKKHLEQDAVLGQAGLCLLQGSVLAVTYACSDLYLQ